MTVFVLALLSASTGACGETRKSGFSHGATGSVAGKAGGTDRRTGSKSATRSKSAVFLLGPDELTKVVHQYQYMGVQVAYYGHVANAAERSPIEDIVSRYYRTLASPGAGKQACSLMPMQIASSVPVVYGRFGPPYLHGANTCSEVVARIFAHDRRELDIVPTVATVLVNGDVAYALLYSRRMPLSYIGVKREGATWLINAPAAAQIRRAH